MAELPSCSWDVWSAPSSVKETRRYCPHSTSGEHLSNCVLSQTDGHTVEPGTCRQLIVVTNHSVTAVGIQGRTKLSPSQKNLRLPVYDSLTSEQLAFLMNYNMAHGKDRRCSGWEMGWKSTEVPFIANLMVS